MTRPTHEIESALAFRDRIEAGEYRSKLEYPAKPASPDLLRKAAGSLTKEERSILPQTKRVYDQAVKDYETKKLTYQTDNARLIEKFDRDLAKEYGVAYSSELFGIIYEKAWEHGHSAGYSEVANYFEEFVAFAAKIKKAKTS